MDTIFAMASARGKAGVSVFRVSGPKAIEVAQCLTGQPLPLRKPVVRRVRTLNGEHIDTGLVIGFPAGQSFTNEDVVEFQLHGSIAVSSAVLDALGAVSGLRLAEPGEFTRRALENGRLDLTQTEGLSDLIDAETDVQRKMALAVSDGMISRRSSRWRKHLVRALALLEATIDFADGDAVTDVVPEVLGLLSGLSAELTEEIKKAGGSERVREGFEVAIVGSPNTGKSTLLNALAGRDAAITSDVPGTTRDVIEVRMDLGGLPVNVLDTAGLRETGDSVERMGVERAIQRAGASDLSVLLVQEGEELPITPKEDDILAIAKGDLYRGTEFAVSGKTGLGVAELVDRIVEALSCRVSESSIVTRVRHRIAITEAAESIDAAHREVVAGDSRVEHACEELRLATRALDKLVGQVDVEDVLDEIFASFCLGK